MRTSQFSAPFIGALISFPSFSWAACRIPSNITSFISTYQAETSHSLNSTVSRSPVSGSFSTSHARSTITAVSSSQNYIVTSITVSSPLTGTTTSGSPLTALSGLSSTTRSGSSVTIGSTALGSSFGISNTIVSVSATSPSSSANIFPSDATSSPYTTSPSFSSGHTVSTLATSSDYSSGTAVLASTTLTVTNATTATNSASSITQTSFPGVSVSASGAATLSSTTRVSTTVSNTVSTSRSTSQTPSSLSSTAVSTTLSAAVSTAVSTLVPTSVSSSEASSSLSGTAESASASTSASSSTVSSSLSSNTMSTAETSSSSSSSTSISTSASASATSIGGNTATTRTKWGSSFDITSNYETVAPDTGVIREYWFELSEVTIAPDGISRYAMAINGSIPGPTIYADWGDTVVVHVTNALSTSHNGTSIHFHGIRQNYTNQNDGVASITQCPTPPGSVETYTWRAVQYGSTWYHSHFALQAWQGVFGGIIINGPASENYDEDLGIMVLTDWDHSTVDELWEETQGGLPTLETGLINGTNVWDDDGTQVGHRWNTSLTEGTSYRLRLVNGAINSHFKFMVDNHNLTVIASDLVPVTPYQAEYINIGMGQRYDVIITANQASIADSFWLRAIPQSTCSDTDNSDDIKGIIYYGSSVNTPTTSAYSYTDSCDDETAYLVPVVEAVVGDDTWDTTEIATLGAVNTGTTFSQRWMLNKTSMTVSWENPSLLQIYDNATFATDNAIIELDGVDEWAYLIIETIMAIPHPIHLHGHDFYVLAQGTGDFSSDSVNLDNPPRRDTAMLPGQGYLAIAFKTDNPGAWLMHCHIGWHTTEGFAIQFIERKSEIMALTNTTSLASKCDTWAAYQSSYSISQGTDSGI